MFEMTAHHHVEDNAKLGGIRGYAVFDTEADRDAELARYPKFLRLRASQLTAMFDGSNYTTKPTIEFSARFYPEAGNPANETGAKRTRRFLALAEYTYAKPYKNSISTLDAALALLPN